MSNDSDEELAVGWPYSNVASRSFFRNTDDVESAPCSMVLLEEEASGGLYSRRGPSTGLRVSAIASS